LHPARAGSVETIALILVPTGAVRAAAPGRELSATGGGDCAGWP
jgi:hypothetical protein